MIKKYLVAATVLLLVGCSDPVKVSPDRLPDAHLNKPYEANIEITGGVVVKVGFYSEVSDGNFEIIPSIAEGGYKDYNLLTVAGTPTTLEPIHIEIVGDTYGTNFPGKQFEKMYTIEVKE